MRLILDADSLIYSSCFNVETLEEAQNKFETGLSYILSDLSDVCEFDDILVCNGSVNNFRKDLNKEYKANRTQKRPEFLSDLHKYVKKNFKSYWTDGYETDDVVATLWKQSCEELGEDNVIIAANDKDYLQFPCWFFDTYRSRRELRKIDEFEAKYNFYHQMIMGDTADNVKYCKGYGKAKASKILKGAKTEFSLIRRVYSLFKEIYGADAKGKFLECKKLLKLDTKVSSISKGYNLKQ